MKPHFKHQKFKRDLTPSVKAFYQSLIQSETGRQNPVVIHSEWANLPDWAGGDPVFFLERAETLERKNGVVTWGFEIDYHPSFSEQNMKAVLKSFMDLIRNELIESPIPMIAVIHQKHQEASYAHVHFLLSDRPIFRGSIETPEDFFSKKNPKVKVNGMGTYFHIMVYQKFRKAACRYLDKEERQFYYVEKPKKGRVALIPQSSTEPNSKKPYINQNGGRLEINESKVAKKEKPESLGSQSIQSAEQKRQVRAENVQQAKLPAYPVEQEKQQTNSLVLSDQKTGAVAQTKKTSKAQTHKPEEIRKKPAIKKRKATVKKTKLSWDQQFHKDVVNWIQKARSFIEQYR